jgi:hypothetical protein
VADQMAAITARGASRAETLADLSGSDIVFATLPNDSALLAVVAVMLGSLILLLIVWVNGISGAELQLLAAQMGMTPVVATLVLAAVSLALSFPMTLAGFRIGAGQVAKQIEKQAKMTGI